MRKKHPMTHAQVALPMIHDHWLAPCLSAIAADPDMGLLGRGVFLSLVETIRGM